MPVYLPGLTSVRSIFDICNCALRKIVSNGSLIERCASAAINEVKLCIIGVSYGSITSPHLLKKIGMIKDTALGNVEYNKVGRINVGGHIEKESKFVFKNLWEFKRLGVIIILKKIRMIKTLQCTYRVFAISMGAKSNDVNADDVRDMKNEAIQWSKSIVSGKKSGKEKVFDRKDELHDSMIEYKMLYIKDIFWAKLMNIISRIIYIYLSTNQKHPPCSTMHK